ncbi:hypothetical protein GCM10020254_83070 [Streptomyces goshikiensis]
MHAAGEADAAPCRDGAELFDCDGVPGRVAAGRGDRHAFPPPVTGADGVPLGRHPNYRLDVFLERLDRHAAEPGWAAVIAYEETGEPIGYRRAPDPPRR